MIMHNKRRRHLGLNLGILVLCVFLIVLFHTRELMAQPTDASTNEAVAAATEVLEQHKSELLALPGMTAVGVGLMRDGATVGMHIYIQQGADARPMPRSMDGVPVMVIEGGSPFEAHDRGAFSAEDEASIDHTGIFNLPVPMGISTGNVNGLLAGTLGYRVMRLGNPSDVGYVTNNHVAAASGPNLCPAQLNPANLPVFNVNQCQPGILDARGICVLPPIGALVQAVPLVMGNQFLNTVDAAFVKSRRGCVSKNILEVGAPDSAPAFPQLGETLRLSGRTSGVITIRVQTVNATVAVSYNGGICGVARFVNQVITVPVSSGAASLPGDSGSPVVRLEASSIIPVGLNFAGNGFNGIVNPVPLVLNALGVAIDTAPDEAPPAACF
jgi:hypothetical protein